MIPVPRTFYELTALVLHAFDRVHSPFDVVPPADSDVCILEPFYFDHKSTVKNITSLLLLQRVDAALGTNGMLKVAHNLNWVLVCFLLRVSSVAGNSCPIRSLLDLDLENASFTASYDQMSSWLMNLTALDFEPRYVSVLLDDLSSLERAHPGDLSASYDLWPLSSPFVEASLGESARESADVQNTFRELVRDLARVQSCVLQQTEASLADANARLAEMRKKSTNDNSNTYGVLASIFCREIIESADLLPSRFSDLKRFVSQLDIVRKVDPCISTIRQAGFFDDRELILKVLREERRERDTDFVFLFRGSVDLQHESLSTKEDTISPSQYGLELGSSSDYTNLHSNPCNAHSMSFGSSLFSGLLYDPTASVWTYWSSKQISTGYIVEIPITERLLRRISVDLRNPATLKMESSCALGANESLEVKEEAVGLGTTLGEHYSDWFFFPPLPTLVALAGSGEMWHPRTKCGIPTSHRKDTFHFITGMLNCAYRRVPDFLLIPNAIPPPFESLPIVRIK